MKLLVVLALLYLALLLFAALLNHPASDAGVNAAPTSTAKAAPSKARTQSNGHGRPATAQRTASRSRHTEPPSRLDLLDWKTRDVTCYVATGHRTASGVWPREGMAASNLYPLGTRLRVRGVGNVTVTDRVGHSSDVDLFYRALSSCRRFGRRHLHVAVIR